jgi:carbonic anhydrase
MKRFLFALMACVMATPAMAQDAVPVQQEVPAVMSAPTVQPAPVTTTTTPTTVQKSWGYVGGQKPASWGSLDPAYDACKSGQMQSPVNIDQFMQTETEPLSVTYVDTPLMVKNTMQTLQVDYAAGSSLGVGGKSYALQYFTFHTPSEHYFNGASYPMEIHFVHKAQDGTIAFVSVMAKIGAPNRVIEGIWQNAPQEGQERKIETVTYNATELLPDTLEYYKYEGSMTVPPCTEGATWLVLRKPITISQEQLLTFQNMFGLNARPLQPLNSRMVTGN